MMTADETAKVNARAERLLSALSCSDLPDSVGYSRPFRVALISEAATQVQFSLATLLDHDIDYTCKQHEERLIELMAECSVALTLHRAAVDAKKAAA